VSAPAVAAPKAADAAAAEVLFEKGRSAVAAQDWATAEKAFAESQSLDPAVGTLLNLGECRLRLGALPAAWRDFTEAARELAPADLRRDYARGRVAELEKKLPMLAVTLHGTLPGTRVVENGAALPPTALGVAQPVDAGTVVVVVTAPGHAAARFTADARTGEVAHLDVAPGPDEGVGAAAPASSTRTAGFVIGGVGAAGILTGIVTGALALGRASDYRSDCPNQACTSRTALANANSDSSAAKGLAAVSTTGFIAGAAAAGLGVYFVLRHPSGHGESRGPTSALALSPVAGGGVLGLNGTF
jgi:tetratricopeptide (TPR) repeat protein